MVFLIVISALVTIIWMKGNIGDRLGGVIVGQNKEKSDLDDMEKAVNNITQHAAGVFRKEKGNTDKAGKSKNKDADRSQNKKNRDADGSKNKKNRETDGSKNKEGREKEDTDGKKENNG